MNPNLKRQIILALSLTCCLNSTLGQPVDFESQIKPLLSDRCFTCHGPDEKTRKADLRLYSQEGAMAKLDDNLAVIMPGKPEASELYNRLITKEADELMPPPESNLALSDKEKD